MNTILTTYETNYNRQQYYFGRGFDSVYDTALESLDSALQSNGILTVNPYEKPEHTDFYTGDGCFDTDEYYKILARYDTAQSQLWVNPVLLKKKDDE